jgi:transposase
MAIDEKHINGKFHTVFSNAKTGKVALMCSSIVSDEINKCLNKFGDQLQKVKFISRDLSSTFERVSNINFPHAMQIADKFHVIRHGIEAIQAVRIRLKQDVLKRQKEEQKLYERNLKDNKNKDFIGPKMQLTKKFQVKKMENGETEAELLSRSRYLCSMHSAKWNEYQKKRAVILFKHFPEIEKIYDKILEFREWYNPKPQEYEPFTNEKILWDWIYTIEYYDIPELQSFANLVENHEAEILNYHKSKNKTNAIAESLNSKISDAIRKNKGTRDVDYFNFRLKFII